MRALLALLGLLIGLALAGAVFGRLDHLRQTIPDRLPGWSALLSGQSGLLAGQADLARPGLPAVRADWRLGGLRDAGPVWRLRLTGQGVALAGDLTLPPSLAEARLSGGGGTLDLAALSADLPFGPEAGMLRFDRLEAVWRFTDQRLVRLEGQGQVLGLGFDGAVLGDGIFQLTADVGGSWRLRFDIPDGPVAGARGRLSGRLDRAQAGLDAMLVPGPDMPESWVRGLRFLGDRGADGVWALRADLP